MDYFHRRFLKVRFYTSHKGIYILVTQSCINTCHCNLLNGVYFQLTHLRGFEANLLLDRFFSKLKRVVSMHVSVHISKLWNNKMGVNSGCRSGGVVPMGLPLHLFLFYVHSHPRPPSAEYGRTRRDLARARPFLGPYYLCIYC